MSDLELDPLFWRRVLGKDYFFASYRPDPSAAVPPVCGALSGLCSANGESLPLSTFGFIVHPPFWFHAPTVSPVMPKFQKDHFCIDLAVTPASGELAAEDRQCAWELYLEIASRAAVCGNLDTKGMKIDVADEILVDSMESLHEFFLEARAIGRRYPVGRIDAEHVAHLGYMIARLLEIVIRPFLEKWRARYRRWWQSSDLESKDPFEYQRQYPHYPHLIEDWAGLRNCCRDVMAGLQNAYGFVPLAAAVPQHVRDDWTNKYRALFAAGSD